MNNYENCSGIILKTNQSKEVCLAYFIIENDGILSFSENEAYLTDKLTNNTTSEGEIKENDLINNQENTDNKYVIEKITLKDYTINSTIQIYKEENVIDNTNNTNNNTTNTNITLLNKSYFEIITESDINRIDEIEPNNQTIKLFAYKQENQENVINKLYDLVNVFCKIKDRIEDRLDDRLEDKLEEDTEEKIIDIEPEKKHSQNQIQNVLKSINTKSIRDVKYMEELITKLDGKFVNQDDWDKECIKVINPSSTTKDEYEESWIKLENGSDYTGMVKNGMPHGFGKEFRKDGSIYTGYFYQGKWHGTGNITNINLDNYQGEFIDGCICGI